MMKHDHRIRRPIRARKPVRRAGVAMLLVIVAVAVGTILSAAALCSTNHASAMAKNAECSMQSYWSAQSAANYTQELIEQAATLAAVGGPAIPSAITVPGGSVNVTVTDLDGNPPDDTDRELIVTAVAHFNGQEHTVKRFLAIGPPGTVAQAIDPMLPEFAAYAMSRISVAEGGLIGPWRAGPEAGSTEPVKIGVAFSNLSDADMSSATMRNVAFYPGATAGSQLTDMIDSAKFVKDGRKLGLTIPAVPFTLPTAYASLPVIRSTNLAMSFPAGSATLTPGRYRGLAVGGGAVATLTGTSPARYQFNDLDISNSSILRISGHVEIVVRGQFNLTNLSSVELATAGSTLTIYTLGEFAVDNSTIGCTTAIATNSGRSWKSVPYVDPKRIMIRSVSSAAGGADDVVFSLDTNSILVGSVHAPNGTVTLQHNSVILGRATGNVLEVSSGCALLYDQSLDPRIGFTSAKGPLYKSDGTPIDGLVAGLAAVNPLQGGDVMTSTVLSAVTAASGAEKVTTPSLRTVYAIARPSASDKFEGARPSDSVAALSATPDDEDVLVGGPVIGAEEEPEPEVETPPAEPVVVVEAPAAPPPPVVVNKPLLDLGAVIAALKSNLNRLGNSGKGSSNSGKGKGKGLLGLGNN